MVIVSMKLFDLEREFPRGPVVGQLIFSLIDLLSSSHDVSLDLKLWALFNLLPLAPICEQQRHAMHILYDYCSRLGLIEKRQIQSLLRVFCVNEGLPYVSCCVLWLELQRRFSIIEGGLLHDRRCLSTSSS